MLNAGQLLDHAWIAAHIPHQGRMCLLDEVLSWDAQQILCQATGHRDAQHPLRAEGRLAACHAIEYAAQAMAVHGVLLAQDPQPLGVGYLASVRSVQLHAERLDDQVGPLRIGASRLSGDASVILYTFAVHAGALCLAEGRASVVLTPATP